MSYSPDLTFALIPCTPTTEMLMAAVRAAAVDLDTAWSVFIAMVDAAEQEQAALEAQTEAAGEA
jgi:hypothetical protein